MVKLPRPCQCQFPPSLQFFIPVANCPWLVFGLLIGVLFYSYNNYNKSEGWREREERDLRVVVIMIVYRGKERKTKKKWKVHCTK
jgi:hypothetical protein